LFDGFARLPLGHGNPAVVIIGQRQTGCQSAQQNGSDHCYLFHVSCSRSKLLPVVLVSRLPDGDLKTPWLLLQVNVRFPSLIMSVPIWGWTGGRNEAMRILLIEDDTILGAAVRDQIVSDGHSVDWVTRLDTAQDHLRSTAYDLLLLDLMLPDGRGIRLLRDLRTKGDVTPVIILTALDQLSDRIEGLNAGADDYMVKPFDLSELSARLNAVARRYSGNPNPLVQIGDLQIDLAARSVTRAGKSLALTAREWVLFETFVQRPRRILSKAVLEDRLYSFGEEIESNTIEVHVSRLRKKLGHDVIETVRGLGYRLGQTA
jgi:two-component system OmpR family response regulator